MSSNTPHEMLIPGLGLAPQAIGTSAVQGPAIVRPWEKGRYLAFLAIGGALVAADALTVSVKARRKGTSTYDALTESDGTTALTFTVSKFSDTGAVENGAVIGTIDLSKLSMPSSSYEYDAVRVEAVNANNTSPGIIGLGYAILGLFTEPAVDLSGVAVSDDLLLKQLPYTLS